VERDGALAAFEKWWTDTYSPLHFEWGDEAYKHHAQIAWMRAHGFVEDHDEQVERDLGIDSKGGIG
jgi:hypothetical protein